jgi:hypothetical protein
MAFSIFVSFMSGVWPSSSLPRRLGLAKMDMCRLSFTVPQFGQRGVFWLFTFFEKKLKIVLQSRQ